MSKTGRVAVITGAAQGIGKRTAELLAERGYALLLNDLRSAAETLNAARVPAAEVLEVLGDISDEVVVDKIAAAVRERWGRTDVLVNNASISLIAPASRGQLHFWRIPRKAGSSTGTPLLSTEAGLPTEAGKRYVSAIANAQRRISGFSLARAWTRFVLLAVWYPQPILRSCPRCSLRRHDRAALRLRDPVRQRGLRPVSGGRSFR